MSRPPDDDDAPVPVRARTFRASSTTLPFGQLPASTREAASRLSRDTKTPVATAQRATVRPAAVETEGDASKEDPALVIDALAPHLAWMPEDRRPQLNGHVLRGDLEMALSMLRDEQQRFPKNLSIGRSVQVIERALIHRLNRRLEPLDRPVSVVQTPTRVRETLDARRVIDLVGEGSTIEDVIRRSPLKRLETLKAIADLLSRGVVAVPDRPLPAARIDPRSEAAPRPARRETPTADPVRMARLAQQLGMELRPIGKPIELEEDDLGGPASEGSRTTLADPIEAEAFAALSRSSRPPPVAKSPKEEPIRGVAVVAVEADLPAAAPLASKHASQPPPSESAPPEPQIPPPPRLPGASSAKSSASVEATRGAAVEESAAPVSLRLDPREEPPSRPPAATPTPTPAPRSRTPAATVASVRLQEPAPAAQEQAQSDPPPPRPRTRSVVDGKLIAAIVAGFGLIAGALYVTSRDPEPRSDLAAAVPSPAAPGLTPTATSTSTAVAPAPSADVSAAPATVRLKVEVSPDYARVKIDGKKLKLPFDGTLPKDGAKHTLKIEAPGHKTKTIEVMANADTNLVIALEPVLKANPTGVPAPPPDPVYD